MRNQSHPLNLKCPTPGRFIFQAKWFQIKDRPLTKPLNLTFERNQKGRHHRGQRDRKNHFLKSLLGIIPHLNRWWSRAGDYLELGYFRARGRARAPPDTAWRSECLSIFSTKQKAQPPQSRCGFWPPNISRANQVKTGGGAKVRFVSWWIVKQNVILTNQPTTWCGCQRYSGNGLWKEAKGGSILVGLPRARLLWRLDGPNLGL